VSYPGWWNVPLLVVVLLAFGAVVALGVRKRLLRVRNVLEALGAFLLAVVVVPGLAWGFWRLARAVHDGLSLARSGDPYEPGFYRIGFVLAAVVVAADVYRRWRRRLEVVDLAFGAALGWLLLLIAATVWVPAGAYLFAWPLLCSLAPLGVLFARARHEPTSLSEMGVAALCAMPAVALFAPLVALLFAAVRLANVAVPVLAVTALVALLLPALAWAVSDDAAWFRLLLVLAATGFLVAGGLTTKFDAERPVPTSLAYAVDTAAGNAWWLNDGPEVDPWAATFVDRDARETPMPGFFGEPLAVRRAPAPVLDLPPPTVVKLEDVAEDGVRRLRFRVRSARGAGTILVLVDGTTPVVGAVVDGRRAPAAVVPPGFRWGFAYHAPPDDGFEWTLETTAAGRPVVVTAVDRTPGIPAEASRRIRPAEATAARSPIADSTFVRAEYEF
jgi:hypothetical protein